MAKERYELNEIPAFEVKIHAEARKVDPELSKGKLFRSAQEARSVLANEIQADRFFERIEVSPTKRAGRPKGSKNKAKEKKNDTH